VERFKFQVSGNGLPGRAPVRTFFLLLLVTCNLSLTSCGFHLRGAVELPPGMEAVALQGIAANTPLAAEIRFALEGGGGALVESVAAARSVLVIEGERFDRRVATVDSGGRVSAYELTYRLTFQLRSPEGEPLVEQQTVTVVREYLHDADNVLGGGREEEALRREMRRFAVRRMVQRLQSGAG